MDASWASASRRFDTGQDCDTPLPAAQARSCEQRTRRVVDSPGGTVPRVGRPGQPLSSHPGSRRRHAAYPHRHRDGRLPARRLPNPARVPGRSGVSMVPVGGHRPRNVGVSRRPLRFRGKPAEGRAGAQEAWRLSQPRLPSPHADVSGSPSMKRAGRKGDRSISDVSPQMTSASASPIGGPSLNPWPLPPKNA